MYQPLVEGVYSTENAGLITVSRLSECLSLWHYGLYLVLNSIHPTHSYKPLIEGVHGTQNAGLVKVSTLSERLPMWHYGLYLVLYSTCIHMATNLLLKESTALRMPALSKCPDWASACPCDTMDCIWSARTTRSFSRFWCFFSNSLTPLRSDPRSGVGHWFLHLIKLSL